MNNEGYDYVALQGDAIEPNVNANNNILNENIQMNQFFIFDDEIDQNPQNREQYTNLMYEQEISLNCLFSFIRLGLLYLVWYIDNYKLTNFLMNIITYFLIHEALVISNFFAMKSFLLLVRCFNPNTTSFPSLCKYINSMNNFIFFVWVIYCFCYASIDVAGFETSLFRNGVTTYYMAIIVLIEFILFSGFFFNVLFFIIFSPCIVYEFCREAHEEYLRNIKKKQVLLLLKEMSFDDYVHKTKSTQTNCIICTEDYKINDIVIGLPCNNKHVFHDSCIKQWISKKLICPICRGEVNPDIIL